MRTTHVYFHWCIKDNGIPAVASSDLASRLRSWGFTGYRTTDGDGINGINDPNRQNYSSSPEESIALAMRDGETDIDDGGTFSAHLVSAHDGGLINMTTIRRALHNTFQIRFRLGLFDPLPSQPFLRLHPTTDVDTPEARQLNMEASRQGLVLLQNRKKTLPFAVPKEGTIVLIGASINSTRLFGGGHYARKPLPTDSFVSIPSAITALLAAEGSSASVEVHPGIGCTGATYYACVKPKRNDTLVAEATAAAAGATQVVLMLNLQSLSPCDKPQQVADGEEFNPCGYEAEQHDRPHSTPPKLQNEMALAVMKAAAAAKVPVAVVLVHGGGMAIDEVKAAADAIVDAHYPGEATGGPAVADLLYGRYSPAGKMPYSLMPKAFDSLSNFSDMSLTSPPG
jgi:pre-mRNA-splicing factor SYF2/beta-D-xylosidase 4